jgi:chemotaxis protein MotD
MTPTNSLPPQPVQAAPRMTGESKDQRGELPLADDGLDFAALFSLLRAEAAAAADASPEAETVGAGEAPQPRPARSTRAKTLEPEDALPQELLLTLYPQTAQFPQSLQPPANGGLAERLVSKDAGQNAGQAIGRVAGQNAGRDSGLNTRNPPLPAALAASLAAVLAALRREEAPVTDGAADSAPEAALAAPQGQSAGTFAAALASANAAPRGAPQPTEPAPLTLPVPAPVAASAIAASVPPVVQQPLPPATPQPIVKQDMPGAVKTASPSQPTAEDPAADGDGRVAMAEAAAVPATQSDGAPDELLLPAERMRKPELTVTRQETFLAPAGQPPAAQQAAERILADLREEGTPAAPDAPTIRSDAAPSPTRVLHIQLRPAELGLLTVKLSLRDNTLEVKLEAAEHRTVRLLDADKGTLADLLRSAGYAVDHLSVQLPAGDKSGSAFTAPNGTGSDTAAPGGGAQPGGAQSDAQRGQPRTGPEEGAALSGNGDEGDHAHPARSARGDLYL